MSSGADSYETDFFAWTQEQAAALRDVARQRPNFPVDWENLAEEVDCLGKSLRRELHSRLGVIVEHLLKLQYSPAKDPRAGWMDTIDRERDDIDSLLQQNPSLRSDVPEILANQAPRSVRSTVRSLERWGEADAAAAIRAAEVAYTEQQVLGDWWPEPSKAA